MISLIKSKILKLITTVSKSFKHKLYSLELCDY